MKILQTNYNILVNSLVVYLFFFQISKWKMISFSVDGLDCITARYRNRAVYDVGLVEQLHRLGAPLDVQDAEPLGGFLFVHLSFLG